MSKSNVNDILGINEFKTKNNNIWKALLAEFHGNFLLNFFGCASAATGNHVLIALTFGLTIFVVVQALGHVSGAHINPAVTAGMVAAGNISIIKSLLYVAAQTIGAISGSAMVKYLIATDEPLGVTLCAKNVTEVQGFGIESLLGFVLVLTVFGVCDANKPDCKTIAGLAIGLAVALGHLACIQYTGASMNPARSFGAAFIAGNWNNLWVYCVGPTIGGIVAALLYKHVFAAPSLEEEPSLESEASSVAEEHELKHVDISKNEV